VELEHSHSCPAILRRPTQIQASHTFALQNFYIDAHKNVFLRFSISVGKVARIKNDGKIGCGFPERANFLFSNVSTRPPDPTKLPLYCGSATPPRRAVGVKQPGLEPNKSATYNTEVKDMCSYTYFGAYLTL
jgi:hypothetical protein